MNYIVYALNLLLVATVIGGIMLFLHDTLHLNPAFLPVVSVSLITLAVYLGGLVGWLLPMTVLVYVAGLLAAVYEFFRILRHKYSPGECTTSPGIWIFAAFCIFFILRTKGMQVLHVDNFSHWAIIIKEMCLTDGFPSEKTAVVFRNYTPGSASFMYFVCKAVTFTEGHALMAQGIITSSAFAALFCRARFRDTATFLSLIGASALAVSCLELSSASLSIYNFLVDDLLAFVAVACGVIVYAYRRDIQKCIFTLLPVLSMLAIIKSSARIFAALITVMVLLVFRKVIFRGKYLIYPALLIAAQLAFPTFYNWYASYTFPQHTDKFSSDIGGLFSVFVSKHPEYLKGIASDMMAQLTDPDSISVKLILVSEIFALAVLLGCLLVKKMPRIILPAFVCANLTFLFYIAELFVLYGFIFDEREAGVLASFYRYFGTVTILMVMTLFPASIYQLCRLGEGRRRIVLSVIMLSFVTGSACIAQENLIQLSEPFFRPQTVAANKERNYYNALYSCARPHIPRDSSVLIYTENKGFTASILPGYELMTVHYDMLYPRDFENHQTAREKIAQRSYLVVDGEFSDFERRMKLIDYTLVGGESVVYQVDTSQRKLIAKTLFD